MVQRISQIAVSVIFSLSTMTSIALAGPLGMSAPGNAQSESMEKVSYIYDSQTGILTAATAELSLTVQQDAEGNLAFVDSNGVPWSPLVCCAFGQLEDGGQQIIVAAGIFLEQTGAYGAPLLYDGGQNYPFAWELESE